MGILIGTFAGTVFARSGNRGRRYSDSNRVVSSRCFSREFSDGNFQMKISGFFDDSNTEKSREMEKFRITIAEKNLEIRKEFNQENPDWSKIEKIRVEVATEQIKFRTKLQKEFFEQLKKQEEEEKLNNKTEIKS